MIYKKVSNPVLQEKFFNIEMEKILEIMFRDGRFISFWEAKRIHEIAQQQRLIKFLGIKKPQINEASK